MRHARATLAVALTALLLGASSSQAAPTAVHVRVEGATSTVFDGVVQTGGHAVQALSDTTPRTCDGTNLGTNPTPGPTATAATVDALASLGLAFDGQWYAGFEDYLVTQLGPDREDNDLSRWWGLLVNRSFTPVGGCQRQVGTSDEVMWAYDAFSNRPFLWLDGPSTVVLGAPLAVSVSSTAGAGAPGTPYSGAVVGAVGANGQPAAAGVADAATSTGDGSAAVVFHAAGWQRVKARGAGAYPAAIASNSIAVCVEAVAGTGCDGPPPSSPGPPTMQPGQPTTAAPKPPRPLPRRAAPAWTRRFAEGTLRDDRARALRWRGSWLPTLAAGAWNGTLTRGEAGARLALTLGAGRPAIALRTSGTRTRVAVSADAKTRTFTLAAERVPRAHLLVGPRRRQAGAVVVRVISGAVLVDGVGRAA